jgi:hypothetical protein
VVTWKPLLLASLPGLDLKCTPKVHVLKT